MLAKYGTLNLKTRPCYLDIFCRLANETISRFPSCCICQEECLECSCQGRNLPSELECFDMCGSNGQPSGRLQSGSLLWTLQGRSALHRAHRPSFQLSGDSEPGNAGQNMHRAWCWFLLHRYWKCSAVDMLSKNRSEDAINAGECAA